MLDKLSITRIIINISSEKHCIDGLKKIFVCASDGICKHIYAQVHTSYSRDI